MKNLVKQRILRTIMLSLSVSLYIACAEENILPADADKLVGTWRDTIQLQYYPVTPVNHYLVTELVLNSDYTFSEKASVFEVDNGQMKNNADIFEFHGNYAIQGYRISFVSHKYTTYSQGQPVVKLEDRVIFENCTFTITGKRLELNYTTYPADAPVATIKEFHKAL